MFYKHINVYYNPKKEEKHMYSKAEEVAKLVKNENDAEVVIATLLKRFSSQTARDRLTSEARYSKQTVQEAARRAASNLLTSFTLRKGF